VSRASGWVPVGKNAQHACSGGYTASELN
jgi:hypothetical protein